MITLLEFLLKKHIDIDPEAVDLGLPSGTLWCSHNVGANKPEDYGGHFAWGETKPKKEYNWESYKWGPCSKYNDKDNKTLLDLEDDAAHIIMGEDWHMPTKEQMQELLDETTSKWITLNGVKGRLFTGSNGNSIFIPTAGYFGGDSYHDAGSGGYLWLSRMDSGNPDSAYCLYFNTANINIYGWGRRCCGCSVRGVIG